MTATDPKDALDWLEALFSYVPTPEEAASAAVRAAEAKATLAAQTTATLARVDAALAAKSPNACPRCHGSGYVGYRRAGGICFRCDGVGFLPKI